MNRLRDLKVEQERMRARQKYEQKHRPYKRAKAKREARELAAGLGLTPEDWAAVRDRYGRCLRCSSTENLVPDHVRPLYRGGLHSPDNIQPLCNKCNIWKGLKIIDYRGIDPTAWADGYYGMAS